MRHVQHTFALAGAACVLVHREQLVVRDAVHEFSAGTPSSLRLDVHTAQPRHDGCHGVWQRRGREHAHVRTCDANAALMRHRLAGHEPSTTQPDEEPSDLPPKPDEISRPLRDETTVVHLIRAVRVRVRCTGWVRSRDSDGVFLSFLGWNRSIPRSSSVSKGRSAGSRVDSKGKGMRPPREFLLDRGDQGDVSTWKDARRRHVASLVRRVRKRRRRKRRPRMGNACDAHVLDLLRNGRKTPAVEIHPTSPSERTSTRTAPGRETRSSCIPTHASTDDWEGSHVQWLASTT